MPESHSTSAVSDSNIHLSDSFTSALFDDSQTTVASTPVTATATSRFKLKVPILAKNLDTTAALTRSAICNSSLGNQPVNKLTLPKDAPPVSSLLKPTNTFTYPQDASPASSLPKVDRSLGAALLDDVQDALMDSDVMREFCSDVEPEQVSGALLSGD